VVVVGFKIDTLVVAKMSSLYTWKGLFAAGRQQEKEANYS
jgi:hypothetical protein